MGSKNEYHDDVNEEWRKTVIDTPFKKIQPQSLKIKAISAAKIIKSWQHCRFITLYFSMHGNFLIGNSIYPILSSTQVGKSMNQLQFVHF